MKNNLLALGAALAACAPLLAAAQAARPEPPKATPQLTYQSAFADYKPYKEAPLANWRALNDAVAGAPGGASGHAGHSMGGIKGMGMPSAPAASASAPMPVVPMPMQKQEQKQEQKQKQKQMHDGHPKKGGQP